MFDPHRTRRSDRRIFTRKGQVNQASRVNTQPIIEQRLVPIYKDYLIKNNLISTTITPSPPSPEDTIKIEGVFLENSAGQIVSVPTSTMVLSTDPTVNLSSNTGTYGGGYLALYEDTDGFMHLVAAGVRSGQVTLNIPNNVKCRYAFQRGFTAADSATFQNLIKGVYTDVNQTIVSARSNEINFSQYARLSFD